ncbi:MAG: hypothetical protein ACLFUJ_06705 [Phycisphaerae bacterium]
MGWFHTDYAGKLTWQRIKSAGEDGSPDMLYRAAVPGGWLVAVTENGMDGIGTGLTFLPDAQHEWQLEPAD